MNIIYGKDLAGKKFERLENGDLREVQTGKFVPKVGEIYYYLNTDGYVKETYHDDAPSDYRILKHHLVFRTSVECEEYKHYLEVLNKYTFEPDWNDWKQEKWFIFYNCMMKSIDCDYTLHWRYRDYFFVSCEMVKAFVDEVGEDAVKRFMFDIWE